MSSRAPIQVSEDIKNRLDKLKGSNYSFKSISDVIEHLLNYKERTEREREQEQAQQLERMIDLGEVGKSAFTEFRKQMGLHSDANAAALLLAHYHNADKLDKETFDLYRHFLYR